MSSIRTRIGRASGHLLLIGGLFWTVTSCSDIVVEGAAAEGQGSVDEASRARTGESDFVIRNDPANAIERDAGAVTQGDIELGPADGSTRATLTDVDEIETSTCTPNCAAKECGDDGCGGECGQCAQEAYSCVDGICVADCEPACENKECGSDGCGGQCGQCAAGTLCEDSICVCEPQCADKECGDDGCGGECGGCTGEGVVCLNGMCAMGCLPDCDGKVCGDDGCGEACGICSDASPFCMNGQCVETCDASCDGKACGDDGCGGSCGDCVAGEFCDQGVCACAPDCDGKTCGSDGCAGSCGVCTPSAPYCVDGLCATECVPDCANKACGEDGCGESCGECSDDEQCDGGLCVCAPECEGKACGAADGCGGACGDCLCLPGATMCEGFAQVLECDQAGMAWNEAEVCPPGGKCLAGECLSPCEVSELEGSYLGCEFWATDLDNVGDAEAQPVGVVVTVPANSSGTHVNIMNMATNELLTPAALGVVSTMVEPGQLKVFKLPVGFDVDGSGKTDHTFMVSTTTPVAAYQFNPLNGEGVHSNDASLLLPKKVTGYEYFVMAWPQRVHDEGVLRGFVSIVATEPGHTIVSVEPTCHVDSGPGVDGITKGELAHFVLTEGEVLNLESTGKEGEDLTGTYISADKKVSVMAGHECANVPLGIDNCDHLEQQLFALSTWSDLYVATAFKARSATQIDIWRVMAGDNDVTVNTIPPVAGYETFKLQRGQWIQFASADSFVLQADGPMMVGHYLTGSWYPGAELVCQDTSTGKESAIGDPAFILATPVDRFLSEYTVLTPDGYQHDYLNLVMAEGVTVKVDGEPVTTPLEPIGETGYGLARVSVSPGVHTVSGTDSFGMTAYGYDCDVSYAYPGGLWLDTEKKIPPSEPCAVELCGNELDDDCDGETDEQDAFDCLDYFMDADADGAGDSSTKQCLCGPEGASIVKIAGDCDDVNDSVSPLLEELCDGIDNNCNLLIDEGCDDDGDGYCDSELTLVGTPAICPEGGGDCYDYSELVNPAATEVSGNGIDDDCDGEMEGETVITGSIKPDCTGMPSMGATVQAALASMELCYDEYVSSADISSPTKDKLTGAWGAIAHYGDVSNDLAPFAGSSYFAMATGDLDSPSESGVLPGGAPGTLCPAPWTYDNSSSFGDGCLDKFTNDGYAFYDAVELEVTMTAPMGATGFSIDYIFLSQEYEEYIGTDFNDKFYIILKASQTTDDKPMVINFTACSNPNQYWDYIDAQNKKWCFIAINTAFSEPCSSPTTDISGTGYECFSSGGSGGSGGSGSCAMYEFQCNDGTCIPSDWQCDYMYDCLGGEDEYDCGWDDGEPGMGWGGTGSSTGWLTTAWPIEGGEVFSLTFHIHDTSDESFDSAVLIDNFRFEGGVFETGTVTHN